MYNAVSNFLLFQAGWFACVMGGANGMPWLGPIAVVSILTIHLSQAKAPGKEIIIILMAMVLGTTWDSILVSTGLLTYPSGMLNDQVAPYWIIAMWALFATTFNVSMNWMKGRLFIAVLFGGIGGPLAYYAGHKLGAVNWQESMLVLGTLAFGWALMMPLMMRVAERFDGFKVINQTGT